MVYRNRKQITLMKNVASKYQVSKQEAQLSRLETFTETPRVESSSLENLICEHIIGKHLV